MNTNDGQFLLMKEAGVSRENTATFSRKTDIQIKIR